MKKTIFTPVFVLLCSAYILYKYMGSEYTVRVLGHPKILSEHNHFREDWELLLGFVCALCQQGINSSMSYTKADYFM